MDSNTKNILQKFNTQKVEFSLLDDIIKDKLVSSGDAFDIVLKLNKQAAETEQDLNKLQQKAEKLQGELQQFVKRLKDLGLDDSKDVEIAKNKLKFTLAEIKKGKKIAQNAKTQIG